MVSIKRYHMKTEYLEELGLTPNEIKIYLCLLQLGPSKAGGIVKSSGCQNSVVHLTLGKLVASGLVSYSKESNVKMYQANDPKYLLNLADEKRKRLESLVPELEKIRKNFDLPEAEIYQGLTGLKNMCYKLIEDSKPGEDFLFFGFDSTNPIYLEQVYNFYREYAEYRLSRGLVLKGIAHEKNKKEFIKNKWPHKNIKFVPFPIIENISIFRNKIIIVPWEHSQTSFLITSDSLAENFRRYFFSIWESN
jgi:sugar-specific transcriptional regulator TrmB